MLKLLVLYISISIASTQTTLIVPFDESAKTQYPYQLFNSNPDEKLDLFVHINNTNCFFFHFISYSIFYFKKDKSKSEEYSIYCSDESNNVNITIKNMTKETKENTETFNFEASLNITYSDVVKNFWIVANEAIENKTSNIYYLRFEKNISDYALMILMKDSNITYNKTITTDFFHYDHFMFKNLFIKKSSLFGYLCILIGLFIAIFGSLFHRTTAGLNAILFLIGLVNELFEPLLPSNMYTESLAFLIINATALLGIFLGWLIVVNKSIEKIFYGNMLGFVLFNIVSYCYLLIPFNGFDGEKILIYVFWFILAGLFGFLYYTVNNNQLSFIVSTCIVGSYFIMYGYNLFLGGYLELTLVFKMRELSRQYDNKELKILRAFNRIWQNYYVLMYFCVWFISSIVFFLIQIVLRYRREMEKPMSQQKGLFKSRKINKSSAIALDNSKNVTNSKLVENSSNNAGEDSQEEDENDQEEEDKNNETYTN